MRITHARALGVLTIALCACKTQGDEVEPGMFGETEHQPGIFEPEVDLPSGETGDEPDPVELPPGKCIQLPDPYVYGYVHQCEGSIQVSFRADSHSGSYFFTFGPGATNPDLWMEPDNYDLPLVAACCGQYDYANPTIEQKLPYINSCLLDAAQQICRGIPYLLRRTAAQSDDAIKKAALKTAAKDMEARASECLYYLWRGGPTKEDPTRLLDKTWSPKNNVSFTIVDAEVVDWTIDGEVSWNTCSSMYDNDSAVVPTASLEIPGAIAMTQASLAPGTAMTGSGPGDSKATIVPSTSNSSLTLAHIADGTLRVSGLRLEAGPSMVSVYGLDGTIERSLMILREVMEPRSAGGEYTVGIGDAHFVVTATFEGDSRIIDFTNADPIVFRQTVAGGWEFDPFDLFYTERESGTWTLSFDGLLFYPAA
jgi:hypothetical protein